jgi:hypothetical protein
MHNVPVRKPDLIADPVTEHCLYVLTRTLDINETEAYITNVVADVERIICTRSSTYVPDCKFIINTPPNNGLDMGNGHCFLWVTSVEVFRTLIGKNYDGTIIISVVTMSPKESETKHVERATAFNTNWADEIDEKPAVITQYIPPAVFDTKNESLDIKFYTATFARVDSYTHNDGTLFCQSKLPREYRDEDLCTLFAPFVVRGTMTVKQTPSGNAIITFTDKDSAYFALCMRKKYYDEKYKFTLSFDHARKQTRKSGPSNRRGANNQYNQRHVNGDSGMHGTINAGDGYKQSLYTKTRGVPRKQSR